MNNSYIANEIKSRVKMPELLRCYGIEVDRKKRIACPLHSGTDKNCGVKDDYIHCFVCNESADQIGFVQKYFSLCFADAVSKINTDFSLGLPIGERIDRRRQTDIAKQAFLRKQEIQKKHNEHEKYINKRLEAYAELARLEKQKREYRPTSLCDELHPRFIEAINNIEFAKYKIACAEEDLYDYEKAND